MRSSKCVRVPLFGMLFGSITAVALLACTGDSGGEVDDELGDVGETAADTSDGGDGDGDTSGDGDGDGDTSGDGDGDMSGDGDGDGDGDACANDPGWGQLAVGQPVKHVTTLDHMGNERSLCEWAGNPFAIDVSAVWCGPCHAASEYLATGTTQDPFAPHGPGLRALIEDGTGAWLTYLVQDANSQPAAVSDATAWDAMYHHPNIPVLAEGDTQMLPTYLQVACWPSAYVVDKDLNFLAIDDCQTWNHLQTLITAAAEG